MATTVVNGCAIHYEEMGAGEPIVFTPGGRSGGELVRPIAELMAPRFRSFIYDRRNCGASDVIIGGDGSDQEIWADDLATMIRQLELGPVYLGGWSAGCRVSLLTAIRHPDVVKGLILGWVTGGATAAERLAYQYYGQFIEAAKRGGMRAVADTEFFAERIVENASNRERLMSMQPAEFISVMRRWSTIFTDGAKLSVIGATDAELAQIRVPTMIVAGDDDIHTLPAAQNLHRLLPNSEYHDPVIPREEWDVLHEGHSELLAKTRAERAGPIFLDFLARTEAALQAKGGPA